MEFNSSIFDFNSDISLSLFLSLFISFSKFCSSLFRFSFKLLISFWYLNNSSKDISWIISLFIIIFLSFKTEFIFSISSPSSIEYNFFPFFFLIKINPVYFFSSSIFSPGPNFCTITSLTLFLLISIGSLFFCESETSSFPSRTYKSIILSILNLINLLLGFDDDKDLFLEIFTTSFFIFL